MPILSEIEELHRWGRIAKNAENCVVRKFGPIQSDTSLNAD
jgi:hypothetical protein